MTGRARGARTGGFEPDAENCGPALHASERWRLPKGVRPSLRSSLLGSVAAGAMSIAMLPLLASEARADMIAPIGIPLNTTGGQNLASALAAMSTSDTNLNAPAPAAINNPQIIFNIGEGIPAGSTIQLVDFTGVTPGSKAFPTPFATFEILFTPPGGRDPGYVFISSPNGSLVANAVSGNATVVGTDFAGTGGTEGAFIWTPTGGFVDLGSFAGPTTSGRRFAGVWGEQ
jgi:hypothetical protein